MDTQKYRLTEMEKLVYDIAVQHGGDPQELLSDPHMEATFLATIKERVRIPVLRGKLLGNPTWAKKRVAILEGMAAAGTI